MRIRLEIQLSIVGWGMDEKYPTRNYGNYLKMKKVRAMETITNVDKKGNIIPDLSKVKLPSELEKSIFKILNPTLKFKGKEVKAQ